MLKNTLYIMRVSSHIPQTSGTKVPINSLGRVFTDEKIFFLKNLWQLESQI